jgi:glycosyltransferase involved in cell wall biosynthesis
MEEIALSGKLEAIWLPGQFSDHERVRKPSAEREGMSDDIRILCVSTIEPRKNHRVLVGAFRALRARRRDLDVRLVLVGNSYAGAAETSEWLMRQCEEDDRIVWHGIVSDATLATEYRRATFSVYPSLAEGFGLPIMESLWLGLPCICNEAGVMAELAADGGCLTVDMTDPVQVSLALERLCENPRLRSSLAQAAAARRIDTWNTYADEIGSRLAGL